MTVFAAEAGAAFTIRHPAEIVRGDVLQAEPGIRADAVERRIVDLEQLELEPGAYDLVLFVDVLEHIREPLRALPKAWRGLRPNGLLVVIVPNSASVKGVIARLTPTRLRHAAYRRMLKSPFIDVPVRNVHAFSLRPSSLRAAARDGGWTIEYFRLYEGPVQRGFRERIGFVGRRWSVTVALTRILSFGLLSADETGIIAVLSKSGLPGL